MLNWVQYKIIYIEDQVCIGKSNFKLEKKSDLKELASASLKGFMLRKENSLLFIFKFYVCTYDDILNIDFTYPLLKFNAIIFVFSGE